MGLRPEGAAVQLRGFEGDQQGHPQPLPLLLWLLPVGQERVLRIRKRVASPVDAHLGRHSPAAGVDAHRAEAARAQHHRRQRPLDPFAVGQEWQPAPRAISEPAAAAG